MKTRYIICALLLAGLVLSGGSTAAQSSTEISVTEPANGTVVSRTFILNGSVSRGGGSLQLKIDGLSYLPPAVRGEPGEITEGVTFAETTDGVIDDPLFLEVNLDGSVVVSSGGTDRQAVGDGPHQLQVCQVFGPATGCSSEITVIISSKSSNNLTTSPTSSQSPSPTLSPRINPDVTPANASFGQIIPILIATLFGGLVGYGGYRFINRRR